MKLQRLLASLLVIFAITVPGILYAQVTVSGKVIDSKTNSPLPGATVKVKNDNASTTTDAKGAFTIQAPSAESILTITYVGYGVFETKVGNGDITIRMESVSTDLNDVVVVGYGTQKLRNLTGAITVVDPKKLQDMPVASLTEALRGQVPGLNITGGSKRPGEMATLNIRQQFNWGKDGGNPAPLIVIDDVIQVDPQNGLSSLDRFNLLDLSEVESITVIRDASAAIYGARGSQGAIIIKTKRGKSGPPRIGYSGKFETNDAVSHGKVMNAYDYGVYANRFGRALPWSSNDFFFSNAELTRMKSLNYDWLKNDWSSAGAMQHSLEVSGGSDKATYFTGGSYFTQGANLGSQDFNRYSFRAGTDVKVLNGVKFSSTISAYTSKLEKSFTKVSINDGSYAIGGEQNDYNILAHMPKYIPWVYNIGGVDRYISPAMGPHRLGTVSGNSTIANTNYYALLNNGSQTNNKSTGYNANFSLQYDVPFVKGLSAKVSYGLSNSTSVGEQVFMPVTLSLANNTNKLDHHLYDSATFNAPAINRANTRVTYDNITGTNEQINFFLTYDREFGDHSISVMAATERTKNLWEERYQIYDNPIPGAYNGTSASAGTLNAQNSITYKRENGTLAYLGRANYSYKNKYLASFVFRSDASTIFAPENYWGFFPSGSLGWVLSEEDWFREKVRFVDNLKLRVSIGKTGNTNIKAWQWMQLYKYESDKAMGFGTSLSGGGGLTSGITPEVSPNRDVKWDKTIQRDLGLDFTVLRNRLSVSIDQYFNTSTDLFMSMSGAIGVPISVGGAFAEENYGGVKWHGTEITATWRDMIAKKVSYSVSMNFGTGENKVTKTFDQPFDYPSKMSNRKEVGQSTFAPVWGFRTWKNTSSGDGMLRTDADLDAYWAYLTDLAVKSGVPGATANYLGVTTRAGMKLGMLAYEDVGGQLNSITRTYAGQDGRIAQDMDYVILKKNSKSYGVSTNLSVSYAGITLQAQISTSWGGLNRYDWIKQGTGSTQSMWAQPIYLNDMFDPVDNPDGKYPNVALYDAIGGQTSDFFTISSFRMFVRTLSIGYSLPVNWAKKAHLENARLFLSGNNLWDFFNPYPNKYRNMYDAPNTGYPTLRTWALGVNLGF